MDLIIYPDLIGSIVRVKGDQKDRTFKVVAVYINRGLKVGLIDTSNGMHNTSLFFDCITVTDSKA